jgi:hypothetical protein
MTAWWLFALPAFGSLADDLASIDEPGTMSWDMEVRFRLLVAYDRDMSDWIEPREAGRIPCEVWDALDLALASGGRFHGIVRGYGFADGLAWNGHLLGFSERARRRAETAIRGCGITDQGPWTVPDHAAAALLRHDVARDESPGARILEVRTVLVATYDADNSGAVEDAEWQTISCGMWDAVNVALGGDLVGFGVAPDPDDAARIGLVVTDPVALFGRWVGCGLVAIPPFP